MPKVMLVNSFSSKLLLFYVIFSEVFFFYLIKTATF